MAFATETRNVAPSAFERFSNVVREMRALNKRYRVYRQTERELSRLSNRDLDDLGLNRSTIRGVAHEAAFGK